MREVVSMVHHNSGEYSRNGGRRFKPRVVMRTFILFTKYDVSFQRKLRSDIMMCKHLLDLL